MVEERGQDNGGKTGSAQVLVDDGAALSAAELRVALEPRITHEGLEDLLDVW